MRTGSLRGSSLARLVQAYHVSHAGPRSVGRSSRTGRKKLPPGKYHSAFPNCVTCWRIYSGEDGTALNICCTGLTGEESINSKLFATTTESAARPCQPSIYNCSTIDTPRIIKKWSRLRLSRAQGAEFPESVSPKLNRWTNLA